MGWEGRPLPAGEGKRKLVHASMGLFALALPFLSAGQAAFCAVVAFLFNLIVLPRVLGHRLTSARADVSDRGVLLYPLVVLGLIVIFRNQLSLAALGWGVLALGDSAAGVVGQKWGARRLPWHAGKTWEGLAAFVIGGLVGGCALYAWCVVVASPRADRFISSNLLASAGFFGQTAVGVGVVALVPLLLAAVLESLPHGLDDNVLPPVVVPLVVAAVAVGDTFSGAPGSLAAAVAVNTFCAIVAGVLGVLRAGGIAVAWILGVVTWVAAGARGFGILLAFLVFSTILTFVGYRRKRSFGAAEGSGGRRGATEILAKGGVLLAFAATALVSGATSSLPWWVMAAVLGAASADTWGTEVGSLLGKSPFTLLPLRSAAAGTPGAVSWPGLAASLCGACFIAGLSAIIVLPGLPPTVDLLPVAAVALAGFLAAVTESVLPALGPATHAGKNLAVTVLGPLYAYVLVGVLQ